MHSSEPPRRRPLKENIRRKLDRPLYTLLEAGDDGIRELVRTDVQRIKALRQRIERERRKPEKKGDARAVRQIDLLPHPLLWPVIRKGVFRTKLRAIVQFTGNRSDLESLGVRVRTQAQDIFTIIGTRNQLARVAAQPACLRMRTPKPVLPMVDEAANQAQVYAVHTPRPVNPNGYTGDGVLLCIIDSPLDVTHATFREAAAPNGSRVLYYWVQEPDAAKPPGQPPPAWSQALPARSRCRSVRCRR